MCAVCALSRKVWCVMECVHSRAETGRFPTNKETIFSHGRCPGFTTRPKGHSILPPSLAFRLAFPRSMPLACLASLTCPTDGSTPPTLPSRSPDKSMGAYPLIRSAATAS